jgi:hypothetical protein
MLTDVYHLPPMCHVHTKARMKFLVSMYITFVFWNFFCLLIILYRISAILHAECGTDTDLLVADAAVNANTPHQYRTLCNNTTVNSLAMHSDGTWATMSFLMILGLVNQFDQPPCNFWYLTLYCWPAIVLELGHHYILISLKNEILQ